VADAITVPRFSVAPDFNTTAMVYRPAPLQRATYQYSRWRVNPGAMTADYLARDLRHAGLFTAVFTSGESGQSRYMLEGGVTEIQEINGPDAWHAALGLSITLLDRNETEITRQVVFQKQYRAEELLTAKTPQGLAEAMSRALARLSGEILRDVGRTVKGRTP
jgi:cholesterol transport system auxiliary component